jgi:RAT1-interacting protein
MESHHRLQSYFGYAFESYCTSVTPQRQSDPHSSVKGWGGDVDTNVQWCSVVKTKLGDTRMVIGGEVDCVRGEQIYFPSTTTSLKVMFE